jgi:phosphatidylserine decarboxylase
MRKYTKAALAIVTVAGVVEGSNSPPPHHTLAPAHQFLHYVPLRLLSSLTGALASVPVPRVAREPLYRTYGRVFGAKLDEAELPLSDYGTLGSFFARRLVAGARPIADVPQGCLVSPVDGTVAATGPVDPDSGHIDQVKGMSFDVTTFLGSRGGERWHPRPGNALFYCTLYLAPGDYHRFHSPTSWTVHRRLHVPGHLLPVTTHLTTRLNDLFLVNERVVLVGEWDYGRFSYTPVGATNVGSITVAFDEELKTNSTRTEDPIIKEFGAKQLRVGEEVGSFNAGSTVVMVFEAPKSFSFSIEEGQKVQVGRPIGGVADATERSHCVAQSGVSPCGDGA